jgi:hypothetical protein
MNYIESIQLFFDEHQELETEARINLRISERINFIEILQNFDSELFKFRQEIHSSQNSPRLILIPTPPPPQQQSNHQSSSFTTTSVPTSASARSRKFLQQEVPSKNNNNFEQSDKNNNESSNASIVIFVDDDEDEIEEFNIDDDIKNEKQNNPFLDYETLFRNSPSASSSSTTPTKGKSPTTTSHENSPNAIFPPPRSPQTRRRSSTVGLVQFQQLPKIEQHEVRVKTPSIRNSKTPQEQKNNICVFPSEDEGTTTTFEDDFLDTTTQTLVFENEKKKEEHRQRPKYSSLTMVELIRKLFAFDGVHLIAEGCAGVALQYLRPEPRQKIIDWSFSPQNGNLRRISSSSSSSTSSSTYLSISDLFDPVTREDQEFFNHEEDAISTAISIFLFSSSLNRILDENQQEEEKEKEEDDENLIGLRRVRICEEGWWRDFFFCD